MSALTNTLLGVAGTLLVTGLLAFLRLKQLYLVVPKLFEFSALTDKGTILELQIFNRGRVTEEDIHIDLPPHITYELIASDLSNAIIAKTSVILPRLAPLSEASIILLSDSKIEPSTLTINISSKTTKGKVFKKVSDVPPNSGQMFAAILAFIGAAALFVTGTTWWDHHERDVRIQAEAVEHKAIEEQVAALLSQGWSDTERFFELDMHNSYQKGEFPFRYVSAKKIDSDLALTFDVINKTALPATLTAYFDCAKPKGIRVCIDLKTETAIFGKTLGPLQSQQITVSADLSRLASVDAAYVTFSLQTSDDLLQNLLGVRFHPLRNEEASADLRRFGFSPQK